MSYECFDVEVIDKVGLVKMTRPEHRWRNAELISPISGRYPTACKFRSPTKLDRGPMETPLDFSKYELDALGDDIRSVVNIPGAIGQAAKYAFTLPFVVAIITWVVFNSRMATWVLLPFSAGALVLAFGASTIIGGYFVTRKRLDTVVDASGRVVNVIGEMHTDVNQIRDGQAQTSVQQVAIGLLENAVFPAVFGTITTAAETSLGPLGRLSSRVTKAPMNMVQKSVLSAIEALPDKEIGQLVDDVADKLPEMSAKRDKLNTEYRQIRDRMDNIVIGVSRTALRSVIGLAVVAAIPLFVWLASGWLLT